ncbi:hypothetical protein TNCT6_71830 [Streptomyces sp. 6-11-2]|nr:hypothetical protein TNCT6_71830 [Streptomyces sp. 6-11-2]
MLSKQPCASRTNARAGGEIQRQLQADDAENVVTVDEVLPDGTREGPWAREGGPGAFTLRAPGPYQPLASAFTRSSAPLNLSWSPTVGPDEVYCHSV